ncbi:mannonate dehydratase [Cohnella cellulosilytica]|uniref:mannonate dehydratase n=1 Tax=Cohnella cellulosilytica TaxID=986710 RepID=A0ABW2FE80_9BACL
MLKLAERLGTHESALWTLCKQMGVNYGVAALPPEQNGLKPWDYLNLMQMKTRYENAGLRIEVIESRPPANLIKLGKPGRDEEIATVQELIVNMGKLGIPVWCYDFMADFNWLRTSTATRTRGGALVSSYDHSLVADAPYSENAPVSEDELWSNLKYYLEAIVPVAEKAKVKLALHPDDPPISPIRGMSRIVTSADALQRAVDLVPSEYSGICLCQGVLSAAGEDIPATIRRFAKQDKLFFVHFRDTRGTPERFEETFHDDGMTDMYECIRTYAEVGFDGPLRPDHVPTMAGEENGNPGYETLGRLFAVGYIKGLMDGVYRK